MNNEKLIEELKKKYGHIFSAKQIESAAEHFEKEIDEVNEALERWSIISLLRMAKYDKESGVATTFIESRKGFKGGILVVKAPVYGTIKVELRGERLTLLQTKADLLLRKVVECVEYANEVDPFEEEENRNTELILGGYVSDGGIGMQKCREVLLAELKESVPLLVANNVVKFTLVERKYVSTPDGKYRRVGETKTPVEFRATPSELRQGHERATNMRIHANKTAAELKKPLKGEKLWAYRYHSAE